MCREHRIKTYITIIPQVVLKKARDKFCLFLSLYTVYNG